MRKSKLYSIIITIIGIVMVLLGLVYPMPDDFITTKIYLLIFGIMLATIGLSILRTKM